MKLRISLILFTVFCLFVLDRIFGYIFPAYPVYLNKHRYGYDSYTTNPRNYFDLEITGDDGSKIYSIDRSHEQDRRHEHTEFSGKALPVLAIGDSFTEGQGVKLKDTYIKQIEGSFGDRTIYGLNYGVSGYNIPEVTAELEHFYESKPHVLPELVVYAYVLNDPIILPDVPNQITEPDTNHYLAKIDKQEGGIAYDLLNLRVYIIRSLRSNWLRYLASVSRIVDFALAQFERERLSSHTVQYYLDIHNPYKNSQGLMQTFSDITKMKTLVEKNHGRFLVLIYPMLFHLDGDYPLAPAHQYLDEQLTERKIDHIDLKEPLSHRKTEELWVHAVDQHPNEIAHKIVADTLSVWMKQNLK
ncbi:MAG: hypothetical protein ACXVAX_07860 [Pseudobdellovibrio sp.]